MLQRGCECWQRRMGVCVGVIRQWSAQLSIMTSHPFLYSSTDHIKTRSIRKMDTWTDISLIRTTTTTTRQETFLKKGNIWDEYFEIWAWPISNLQSLLHELLARTHWILQAKGLIIANPNPKPNPKPNHMNAGTVLLFGTNPRQWHRQNKGKKNDLIGFYFGL